MRAERAAVRGARGAGPAGEAMVPERFTLMGKREATAGVFALELRRRSGRSLPFRPGQFTMLSAAGAGEVPISISGDPDRPGRLLHTVRAAGLATQAICRSEPGAGLGVRGPFGRPWPVAEMEGCDVVIAAGGIGLPPLRPAILAMLARRARYGRLVLLYGARTPESLLYTDELSLWSDRGLEVLLTVDSAGPEWFGHVGVITRLVGAARLDGARTAAMCCGPEVMMRFTVAALIAEGLAPERIHLSMERNMQCGIGLCGHCQLGPTLLCRDGPVCRYSELAPWLAIREL